MKWFSRIVFLFLVFIACLRSVAAQTSEPYVLTGEHIQNFVQETTINKNGTMQVKESIVYDFGTYERHGIYREIPYVKVNSEGKRYAMNIKVLSVMNEDGLHYQFKVTTENDLTRIRIGDPDKTITGVHTYTIVYEVSGAITYFADHDELYWNVTGNDWTVPIAHASSVVTLPDPVPAEDLHGVCYTGYAGSSANDCTIKIEDGKVIIEGSDYYPTGAGLTIAVTFPKNIVAVLEPQLIIPFSETWYGKIILFVVTVGLALLGLAWYIFLPLRIGWQWLTHGRDPKTIKPTTAWFDPPAVKGRLLTAPETGTLIDESVDFDDISAMVVQLAQRGYLKIVEKKKNDFYLVKKKEFALNPSLLGFEYEFLKSAFATSDEVHLKRAKLYNTLQRVEDMIYEQTVNDGLFPENPKKIRTTYTVLSILGISTLNIPLFLSAILFGINLPRRTELGAEALGVAKSLMNFLTSQSRQIKFQGEKQLLFERLLPYAVAMRVEDRWVKRFEDLKLPPPDWYEGYGTYRTGTFIHGFHSSMSSLRTASSPPASTSSSGFSSGSSGGSSGGGGGGGGGGSW